MAQEGKLKTLSTFVAALAITQVISIGVIVMLVLERNNANGGGGTAADNAATPELKPLAILPDVIPPEHRGYNWYGVGDEALALAGTLTLGNDPDFNTASFQLLGRDEPVSCAAGSALPLKSAVKVLAVGRGRVLVACGQQRVELVAPGGAPPVDWNAPRKPFPSIAAQPAKDKGSYSLKIPRDPRVIADVEESAEGEGLLEHYYDIPRGEWEAVRDGILAALRSGVLLKDAINEHAQTYGAMIAVLGENGSALSEFDVRNGDVILGIGDSEITSARGVSVVLDALFAAKEVSLHLLRGDEEFVISLQPAKS
ncbi:MAG: hypothetical protein HUU29_09740 [Planctomycetaceae bacterium]|nr:hypothetical protein [Planctomycetaceae bacterium]